MTAPPLVHFLEGMADNSQGNHTMRRYVLRVLIAVAMLGLRHEAIQAETTAAATSACRLPDSASTRMVAWLTSVATGTDSAAIRQRLQMKVQQAPARQIIYVAEDRICNAAVSPYNADSAVTKNGVPVRPSGRLYIVKVGTVYVAWDPVKTWGHFVVYVTMNSNFRALARSLG